MTEKYEKQILADGVDQKLYNLSSQISKLSTGDVKTAELLAGKSLIPDIDPISEYLERKKTEPIKQAISNIQPPVIVQAPLPISEAPQRTYRSFTDDEYRVLEDQEFEPKKFLNREKVVIMYQGRLIDWGIDDEIRFLTHVNKNLNPRNIPDKDEKDRRTRIIKLNKQYRKALQFIRDSQSGSGVTCPVLDQMKERAKVLIGEINAGNTSKALRNELDKVLLSLLKNKVISKREYRSFF